MVDPVKDYANRVLDGRIVAGPSVRAACARHLRDLDTASARDLWFDLDAAQHVFDFFQECLVLRDGQFEGKPFILAPSQKFVLGNLFGWKNSDGSRRFRQSYDEEGKGNGKALAVDTPIATPSGWTTMGEIRPGDFVFGADGRPTQVLAAFDVMRDHECFEVEFDDGETIVADADHLWLTEMRCKNPGSGPGGCGASQTGVPLKDRGAWRRSVRTTRYICETLRYKNGAHQSANHSVPLAKPLVLPRLALPIDPYVLGVWLGDGDADCARVTCADGDSEILSHIEAAGYGVRKGRANSGSAGRYRVGGLQTVLRANGLLDNKHVPSTYLRASDEQRQALVQGLMDTDGYICARSGQCEFTNTNRVLADAFLELIVSLGVKARMIEGDATLYGRIVSKKYRILFDPPPSLKVFRLARKRAEQRSRHERRRLAGDRRIVDCRPCESVPVRCIRVAAPDSLFIAGRGMIPTHNSPLAAGVGIYLFACDDEPTAEVYFAAPTKAQSFIAFNDAVGFVDRNDELSELIRRKGENPVEELVYPELQSKLLPISADAKKKSGFRPHGVIVDEVHELGANEELIHMLRSGFKFRRSPVLFMITNSGYDRQSVCWKYHERAIKVAANVISDDTFFAFVCDLDKGDNPLKDERCWPKANPLLGITMTKGYLRNEVNDARTMGKTNLCLRLNFCQWTSAESAWIPPSTWADVLHDYTPEEIEALRRLKCWGAVDLSRVRDLTALTLMFQNEDGMLDALTWFWTPMDGMEEREKRDQVAYKNWSNPEWEDQTGEEPFLNATPGPEVDYLVVAQKIKDLSEIFDIQAIAFDPYEIERLKRALKEVEAEVTLKEHVQGARMTRQTGLWMPGSINLLESAIFKKEIRIQRNPVMSSCAMSAVTKQIDPIGNRIFDKAKSTRRIDGVVTLAMARGALEKRLGPERRRSIYEQIAEQRKAAKSAGAAEPS